MEMEQFLGSVRQERLLWRKASQTAEIETHFADTGKFCIHGVAVALASAAMKPLRLIALLLCAHAVASAQTWSASIASGPFIFGDFAETVEFIGPVPTRIEHSLTGDTNVGIAFGLERYFNQRFS